MEQIHAQQTVQLKKEMDNLQGQIAQMQLQRGVEVSQTGAAQIQATQERQEMMQQQQQMATSVQQLAHEIRALKEDLTRSENARQDLENLVRAQATQSREPVYENEGSLRSKPIPISMTEKRGHEDFQSGAPQGLNSIFSAPPAGASTSNQPMATVPPAPAFSFTRAPPLSSAARRRTNGPSIQPTQPQTNISTTPLAMGNPFPPVQIKPKDPPSFKGALDEDVSAWLQTLDDFQWFTRMTDEQIYGYAVMQLQGDARVWWNGLLKGDDDQPRNWAEFKTVLEDRFKSKVLEREARAQLRVIRQGQGESVRSYASRFQKILAQITKPDQVDVLDKFVDGLFGDVQMMTAASRPDNLAEAINIAEEMATYVHHPRRGIQGQGSTSSSSGKGQARPRPSWPPKRTGGGGTFTRNSSQPKKQPPRPPQRRVSTMVCDHCKRPGHTKNNCYILHGFPDQPGPSSGGGRGWSRSGNTGPSSNRGRGGRGPVRGRSGPSLATYFKLVPVTEGELMVEQQPPNPSPESAPGPSSGNA